MFLYVPKKNKQFVYGGSVKTQILNDEDFRMQHIEYSRLEAALVQRILKSDKSVFMYPYKIVRTRRQ